MSIENWSIRSLDQVMSIKADRHSRRKSDWSRGLRCHSTHEIGGLIVSKGKALLAISAIIDSPFNARRRKSNIHASLWHAKCIIPILPPPDTNVVHRHLCRTYDCVPFIRWRIANVRGPSFVPYRGEVKDNQKDVSGTRLCSALHGQRPSTPNLTGPADLSLHFWSIFL